MANNLFIGFNGDIDSQILAILLTKQGFSVKGVYYSVKSSLLCVLPEPFQYKFNKDEEVLKLKAKNLNIDLEIIDVSDKFYSEVIENVIAARLDFSFINYNQIISKFIIYRSLESGENFALGYYVKYLVTNDRSSLLMHSDLKIDQSYLFCHIDIKKIEKIIFPLGELSLNEKNKILASYKLTNTSCVAKYDLDLNKFVAKSLIRSVDFSGSSFTNIELELSHHNQKVPYTFKIQDHKALKTETSVFELRNSTVQYFTKPLEVYVLSSQNNDLQHALLIFNTNDQIRLEFNKVIPLQKGQLVAIYESAHKNAKLIGSAQIFKGLVVNNAKTL